MKHNNNDVIIENMQIPDNNVGYARGVMTAMQLMVAKGIEDERVQYVANNLIGRTDLETLKNDFRYLKDRIPYEPDPVDSERVTSARFTIGYGTPEDCDGMAVAAASLLYLQDIPCHFEAIEWREDRFTHVIVVVDLEDRQIAFDLTMNELGEEHDATKLLEFPIMANVQMISDVREQITIGDDLLEKLTSHNYNDRVAAFNILHLMYPNEMTAYVQRLARQRMLTGGIGDGWSKGLGWLGSVLTGGLVPSDVIETGVDFLAAGSSSSQTSQVIPPKQDDGYYPGDVHRDSDKDSSIKEGDLRPVQMSLVNNHDETHPGRTVTSPITFCEELPQIYYSDYPPKGNVTIPFNYSCVILPQIEKNVPVWNKLKAISPGLIFVSFDDQTAMLSDYTDIVADQVGMGFQLVGIHGNGTGDNFPGFYTRTKFRMYPGDFEDRGIRYDFVGMSPKDIPNTDNGSPITDWTKSTAYMYLNQAEYSSAVRYDVGTSIPTTTPSHVTITPGTSTGGSSSQQQQQSSGGGGGGGGGGQQGNPLDPGSGGTNQDLIQTGLKLYLDSKKPAGGYTVTGTAPPLQNPNGGFMEYLPWIAGGVAAVVVLALVIKK